MRESIPKPPDDLGTILTGDSEVTGWFNPCGSGPAFYWVDPDDGPDAPAPELLAWAVYVRLEDDLPELRLAADPPLGESAIIHTPSFVEVTNWVDGFRERECAGPVCVSVTATPSLTWTPGEPGAGMVACEDGGTRYEPDVADGPETQAQRPGACAWAYSLRTGRAARREDAWEGEVTVSWELSWTSSSGSGTLPTIERSAELSRAVDEVQGVVTEVQ